MISCHIGTSDVTDLAKPSRRSNRYAQSLMLRLNGLSKGPLVAGFARLTKCGGMSAPERIPARALHNEISNFWPNADVGLRR